LRIAHLTDSHVQPERNAFEGMCMALRHINTMKDKPDLIITGGDLIMDSFATDAARRDAQWELFTRAFKEHNGLPVVHCLGNHDIWGWNKAKSKTTGSESGWGKQHAIDLLGLPGAYFTVERAGWKIIVLDSVQPNGGDGYRGGLDDVQFDWLRAELEATPATMPVLIITHVPILHASTVFADGYARSEGWTVGAGEVCADAIRIVNLFRKHPNVRLALSGHIHVIERLDFQGVTYLNSGAISGNWWRSQDKEREERAGVDAAAFGRPFMRCQPSYALVDLYRDGSHRGDITEYGLNL
jgi:3',5'-cyclic AMP phosphodiesterase CpdA